MMVLPFDAMALRVNGAVASLILDQRVTWVSGAEAEIPCLSVAVAENGRLDASRCVPVADYSGDWRHCQTLIDAMNGRGFAFLLHRNPRSLYQAGFHRPDEAALMAEHESPTMAVCLGALMALGILY